MVRAIVSRDSLLFALAVDLFVRHRPDGQGVCHRCQAHCYARERAAIVIAAAGVDPACYAVPPRRPVAAYWREQPTATLPVYRGGEPA
jgi:hypothetical protein